MLALLCGTTMHAADVFWVNLAGGNWGDTNNWSSGTVPGPSDNLFINTNGSYAVLLDINASVANLT